VILLAVPNADGRPHAVSRHLQREADGLETLNPEAIDTSVIAVRATPEPAAPVAEEAPAAAARTDAARPSPTLLAQRRPPPRPVEPAPAARAPSAQLVYSSATGQASAADNPEPTITPDLVAEVCASVLSTWLNGASQDQIAALRGASPLIPGELDRALLTDLSGRINVYYVEEETRRLLRERFWVQLERIAG
jgi:hypothetical protein